MNLEELAREAGVWAIPGALLPPSKIHNERLTHFAALVLQVAARQHLGALTVAAGQIEAGNTDAALKVLHAATRALEPGAAAQTD